MIHFTAELSLDLWYEALSTEFGIKCTCSPEDVPHIQSSLYNARKDIGDRRLESLSIHIPADGTSFWIYRRAETELP